MYRDAVLRLSDSIVLSLLVYAVRKCAITSMWVKAAKKKVERASRDFFQVGVG